MRAVLLLALAAIGARSSDLVEVSEGLLQGRCDVQGGVCAFLGVPYAAPPTRDLRWRPPQPPPRWEGVRDATEPGAECLQVAEAGAVKGDESCLFLNVWTPAAGDCGAEAACAVMFWIHGGAYVSGSGTSFYDGTKLTALARNVVVVTINYRLGMLGFAGSHELRSRDVARGSTGNYGLQDQRFAMEWVQRNIHRFGGDNNNVMIFGESAGGGSVSAHLVMPSSWPLYRKAVLESGSFSYWAAQPMWEASQKYDDLASATGCEGQDRLMCLLAMPGRQLINISAIGLPSHEHPYGCAVAPTVDEVELPQFPWQLLEQGKFNKDVPIMLGYNKDEGTIGIGDRTNPGFDVYSKGFDMTKHDFQHLLRETYLGLSPGTVQEATDIYGEYNNWFWAATHFAGDYLFSCPTRRAARIFNRTGTHSVFQYFFKRAPSARPVYFAGVPGLNGTAGSFHSAELEFVWQVTRDSDDFPSLIGSGERLLAKTMAAYWVNFAVHSDPNVPADNASTELTAHWPPFAQDEASLELDVPGLSVGRGLFGRQCDFIDSLGVLTPQLPKPPQQQQQPQQPVFI